MRSERQSRIKYPRQERPHNRAWGTWRRALKLWTRRNASNHRLKHPLGLWTQPSQHLNCYYESYISDDRRYLLRRTQDYYQIHQVLRSEGHHLHFSTTVHSSVRVPPTNSIPVSIYLTNTLIVNRKLLPQPFGQPRIPPAPHATFHDYLQSLEVWEYQLL